MNIVVDTNIVFSAMLNTNSLIASILTDHSNNLNFQSPGYLLVELSEHRDKLTKIIKINDDEFNELLKLVTQNVTFIQEDKISSFNWIEAERLTKPVDSDDIAFIALSLELKCPLWTGDKKISKAISEIKILNTNEVRELIKS